MLDPLLKQRLIGAITLLILAVLIIPLVLDGPVPGRETVVAEKPILEPGVPRSAWQPLDPPVRVKVDSKGEARVQAGVSAHHAREPAAPPAQAGREDRAKTQREAEKGERAPEAKAAPATGSAQHRYIIQMGLFGEQQNAVRLSKRLAKLGYRSHVDKQTGGNGEVYRVYVGPYPHRQAADASRKVLLKRVKLRGFLRNYP